MKKLEERILKDAEVYEGGVLKVDSFLNHQIDCLFVEEIGKEIYDRFKNDSITKILTVESSGIAVAMAAAHYFKVPVLFAKKTKASTLSEATYFAKIHSFTRNQDKEIFVEKRYLSGLDNILIVDDFLAHGEALRGLISIARQSGAEIKGIAIAIEKAFQHGGDELRKEGYDIFSLAIIESMNEKEITFRK